MNTAVDVRFSAEGRDIYSALVGRRIETPADLTSAIIRGEVHPSQIPVEYVRLDGQSLILNTRTSTALRDAGIPQSEWYGVNRTGQIQIPATEFSPARTFDQAARAQLKTNTEYAIPGQVGWPQLLVPRVK